MVGINDSSGIDKIHFVIHVNKTHDILVMIILYGISVLADGTAQDDMCQIISGRIHFIAAESEVMGMLRCIDRIEHDGKVTARRILHAGSNIKTADGQPVLLILYGTCADCHIREQVGNVFPVFRIEHFICRCQTTFTDGTQMHFSHGDQSCDHIRCFFRIRLRSDALVSFAGGPGLVCVDTGDQQQTVFYFFLYFGKAVHILAYRILAVCGTGADDNQKAVIFSCEDVTDLRITAVFNSRHFFG